MIQAHHLQAVPGEGRYMTYIPALPGRLESMAYRYFFRELQNNIFNNRPTH